MNTIVRTKKLFFNDIVLILKINFETIMELQERYENEAIYIYGAFFNPNLPNSIMVNYIYKMLACSVKNMYIDEEDIRKLLFYEHKKINKIVSIYKPFILYLLDGFILENAENNENEADLTKNEPENNKKETDLTDLLYIDNFYAKSLKLLNFKEEDFLNSTPKAILELLKIINNNGEISTGRYVDNKTGEEYVIEEIDANEAFSFLPGF